MLIDSNVPAAHPDREPTYDRTVRSSLARSSLIRLRVERLEPRLLMTQRTDVEPEWQLSHGGACGCSICGGLALASVPDDVSTGAVAGTRYSLAYLPQLNSLPGAATSLYLDFDGYRVDRWGSYANVSANAFDRDGDATTFSEAELQSIREIWARTAEDYSPFQINVTTVDPGYEADRSTARIVVGGHWRDWFGESAGGIAYVGGFYNSSPNVGFAFEDALGNGNPRYVAEAVSHEAGHLFGLQHQSLWSSGSLANNYSTGNSLWAPIMGVGYYAQRTTWTLGTTAAGAAERQDDMETLANGSSRLGYRADEAGGSASAALQLRPTQSPANSNAATFQVTGLIGRTGDEDWYGLSAGNGPLTLELQVAALGANLDGELELRTPAGRIVSAAAPGDRLGASLSADVTEGLYYVVVRGGTDYGNTGSYTLSGSVVLPQASVPPTPSLPISRPTTPRGELDLFVNQAGLPADAALSFGHVSVGRSVDRVLSLRNTGQGPLQLDSIDTSSLPASFKLITSPPSGILAPGRTVNLRIRLNASSAGDHAGHIRLLSDDPDEGQLIVRLAGTATPAPLIVDDTSRDFQRSGVWNLLRTGRARSTQIAAAGKGEAIASWNVQGLIPGQYRVYATWPASPMLATDAPFTLLEGSQPLAAIRVNQQQTPTGFSASGSPWSQLTSVAITGQQLTIRLGNDANNRVAADAIRVEWAGPPAEAGTLQRTIPAVQAVPIPERLVSAAFACSRGDSLDRIGSDANRPFATVLPAKTTTAPVARQQRTVVEQAEIRGVLVDNGALAGAAADRAAADCAAADRAAAANTAVDAGAFDGALRDPFDWLAPSTAARMP